MLVSEVENHKNVLFGSHSSGVTNKRKCCQWQQVVTAVNSVSGTERTMAEVKKKWSDLKVEAKKRLTHHCQILSGGKGLPELTPFEKRIGSILRETNLSGIVPENEGDTDLAETTDEPGNALFHFFIKCAALRVVLSLCPQVLLSHQTVRWAPVGRARAKGKCAQRIWQASAPVHPNTAIGISGGLWHTAQLSAHGCELCYTAPHLCSAGLEMGSGARV